MRVRSLFFKVISLALMVAVWSLNLDSVGLGLVLVVILLLPDTIPILFARYCGFSPCFPYFWPLGTVVTLRRDPPSVSTEMMLAMLGRVTSIVSALMMLVIGLWLKVPEIVMLIRLALFVNLVNLIPLPPLSGGSMLMKVTKKTWMFGLAGLGVLILTSWGWITLYIAAVAIMFAYRDLLRRQRIERTAAEYFETHPLAKVKAAVLYVLLTAGSFLLWIEYATVVQIILAWL